MRAGPTLVLTALFFSSIAGADFFGGDLPLLSGILANTIEQLTKLKSMSEDAQKTLALLEDINRGLDEAINIAKGSEQSLSPGALSQFSTLQQLKSEVARLYGEVPKSSMSQSQAVTDEMVAESFHLHNEAFRYAQNLDREMENLKAYSKQASPAAAQKATLQSVGVLVQSMNQLLRTTATGVKLQSEAIAIQNQKDKQRVQNETQFREALIEDTKKSKPSYSLPALKF